MAVTEGQLISDGTAVWKVKKIGSEVPAGTMQMFAGNTIPAGWLLCDGSAVSRTNYAKLFSAIGTIYGEGDGSTTFALPNLIDRVVQGAATAGTYKDAGLPNITGTAYGLWCSTNSSESVISDTKRLNGAFKDIGYDGIWGVYDGRVYRRNAAFNASYSNAIYGASTTVQPPALTMLPIIKYQAR